MANTLSPVLTPTPGPTRFARFAFPPNRLGYCGPNDGGELAEYVAGRVDAGLREIVTGFEGAFPYLQLLAASNHRTDPLDADVVEAYWIGNALLDQVSLHDFGLSIDDRFRRRAGTSWRHLTDSIPAGVANHSYHVFHVMPWAGLLRDGVVAEPLEILDRCRISWATVVGFADPDTSSGTVLVRRDPLRWSGSRLLFDEPVIEAVESPIEVEPGDVVAIHWNWICERISETQLGWLQRTTRHQLAGLRAG
jgi:hypothetical protein